jgi:chemotaxis protein CheC
MTILDRKLYEDILRELCSLGAGSAATNLSKILDKRVRITVPKVWIKLPEDPYLLPGKGKEIVVAIDSHFGHERRGVIFYLLSRENAVRLIEVFLNEGTGEIGELEESALLEVCNILSGGIIGALAKFLGEKIMLDPPHLTLDYPLAIIDYALGEQTEVMSLILFTSVNILAEGEEISLVLLFFPFFDVVEEVWRKAKEEKRV